MNTINNIFKDEKVYFKTVYEDIKNESINNKKFYLRYLLKYISADEIFSIFLYTFIKDIKDDFQIKKSSFLLAFTNEIKKLYDHHLKLIHLYIFKNEFLEDSFTNDELVVFKNNIISKYTKNKKNFILTYDIILLEYYKLKYKTLDKRHKIFKEKQKLFLEHYKNNELIFKELHYFTILINDIIKDSIFESFQGKIGIYNYEYMYIFDLKKFNLLKNACYLISQLPMIIEPGD